MDKKGIYSLSKDERIEEKQERLASTCKGPRTTHRYRNTRVSKPDIWISVLLWQFSNFSPSFHSIPPTISFIVGI